MRPRRGLENGDTMPRVSNPDAMAVQKDICALPRFSEARKCSNFLF
ncbi:hypothetical protein SAMN05216304_110112 [Bosea sp. OK403]|nr:hypothetical protein SAMN05216304_110112 [Bosea sp. OK403]